MMRLNPSLMAEGLDNNYKGQEGQGIIGSLG